MSPSSPRQGTVKRRRTICSGVSRLGFAVSWTLLMTCRPSDGFASANTRYNSVNSRLNNGGGLARSAVVTPTAVVDEEELSYGKKGEMRSKRADDSLRMSEEDTTAEDSSEEVASSEPNNEEKQDDSRTSGYSFDRDAIRRASLFSKRDGGSARKRPSTTTRGRKTSVGDRRIGSATKARKGISAPDRLLDTIRKTARGASSTSKDDEGRGGSNKPLSSQVSTTPSSVIQQAIDDLIRSNKEQRTEERRTQQHQTNAFFSQNSFGLLGDPQESFAETTPVPDSADLGENIRIAHVMDYVEVANLRLSVFNTFAQEKHAEFCTRSCRAISSRAQQGASCIVYTAPSSGILIGSAECSSHEFQGTRLGRHRLEGSILYITEMAVHPSTRRQGIGSQLLRAMDSIAIARDVESLYLHVDTTNSAAIEMYVKAGYERVVSSNPIYLEFTTSLNLHPGATKGRDHFLFCKHLKTPTWLSQEEANARERSEETSRKGLIGSLGFEIPA